MLREETFQKLSQMRMHGFSRAFEDQLQSAQYGELAFAERVGLMIDREWT